MRRFLFYMPEPYCIKSNDVSNTCGSNFSPVYWVAFTVISSLIIDPLIAVVCIDAFWRECENGKYMEWVDPYKRQVYKFTHAAAEEVQDEWVKADPYGEAGLTRAELEALVAQVEAPLGAKPQSQDAEVLVVDGAEEVAPEDKAGDADAAAALVERLAVFAPGGSSDERVDYHTALFAMVMEANANFKAGERLPPAPAAEL